jgi:hypothetical protein
LLAQNKSEVSVQDIIQRIERQAAENAELRAALSEQREAAEDGKLLRDILHHIAPGGSKSAIQQVRKRLEGAGQLQHDNDNMRGQIALLRKQIHDAGKGGNEFPSCWVTPEGKTQSIFVLTLTGAGIRIADRPQPGREADKASLPLSRIQYNTELPLGTFLSEARPLYEWSVAHGCRFYVIRNSSVSSAPVQAVNAISNMFYPDSQITMIR